MSGEPQPRARLARTVILLGWVSFFADVSGEMTYPLLPLFVVGALGASATSLGWIEGVPGHLVHQHVEERQEGGHAGREHRG